VYSSSQHPKQAHINWKSGEHKEEDGDRIIILLEGMQVAIKY